MNKLTNQKQFWFLLSGGKNASFLICWSATRRLPDGTRAVNLLSCLSPSRLESYFKIDHRVSKLLSVEVFDKISKSFENLIFFVKITACNHLQLYGDQAIPGQLKNLLTNTYLQSSWLVWRPRGFLVMPKPLAAIFDERKLAPKP